MRLDQYLVNQNMLRSRSQAQDLIKNSKIRVNGSIQIKPSFSVTDTDLVEITDQEFTEFVSRGGIKLKGALARLQLNVEGIKFLDIGLSTGGFTDCLLKSGAVQGIGLDVGHGQLDLSLSKDSRLKSFEAINAKKLTEYKELLPFLEEIDLIVMDVSFISIAKIIPELSKIKKEKTKLLSLVKPQFELNKSRLNKQGIVKEESDYILVEENLRNCLSANEWQVKDFFPSSIEGSDGNKEFFIYAE